MKKFLTILAAAFACLSLSAQTPFLEQLQKRDSTYSFGKLKAGSTIHAEFNFTNEGEDCFCVHRCETDALNYSHGRIEPVCSGKNGSVRGHVDTSMMPKGETLVTVKLTTNSPLRPVINLFITGYLE